jgi:hypothetical protein
VNRAPARAKPAPGVAGRYADRMSKIGWAVYSVVGFTAWFGGTVYVAATNPDPSDARPILRTFAIGAALFFGVLLVVAGLEVRRGQARINVDLYRRLAIEEVPAEAVRAASRQASSTAYVYLIFTGLTTGLFFTGIGLAPDGPYQVLWAAAMVLVLVWIGFAVFALKRTFGSAGAILAPLGLTLTGVPSYRLRASGGGGDLAGKLTIRGERHGRQVAIEQSGNLAVTTVSGQFRRRTVGSAATVAAMTGQPARCWRRVQARAGDHGIEVRRSGNGAGRWYLYDLLLAEHLAAASAASPVRS